MTDKIALTNLANLQNETTAVTAINNNNFALTSAINNTLSRDGTAPNQMGAPLDMNSFPIINIPDATLAQEPVALSQMNAALGALGRVTFNKGPWVNVRDFGAAGTGSVDDTAAFKAAMNMAASSGGGVVYVPAGTYAITQTIIPTVPIMFKGEGTGGLTGVGPPNPATITKILWEGGSAVMFNFTELTGGWGMSDMFLDANNIATGCIYVSSCQHGLLDHIYMTGSTTLTMRATADVSTCSWNVFRQISIEETSPGTACLSLDGNFDGSGNPIGGNFALNSIYDLYIGHPKNRPALLLTGCDNVFFYNTRIIRFDGFGSITGQSGTGVLIQPVSALFPNDVVFYGLSAGSGGFYMPSGMQFGVASIYGYTTENGEPLPVTNGSPLFYINTTGLVSGVTSLGKSPGSGVNFNGSFTYPNGATSHTFTLPSAEPDGNYAIFIQPLANFPTWWISAQSASAFTVSTSSAAGSDVELVWIMIRG